MTRRGRTRWTRACGGPRRSSTRAACTRSWIGLYQVRNNDIANLTIVEGDDGLMIIDCTTGVESGGAGTGPVP